MEGGGGGSTEFTNSDPGYAGEGGSGGSVLIATIPKTSNIYSISIGQAGSGAQTSAGLGFQLLYTGQNEGGITYFNHTNTYAASGGDKGASADGSNRGSHAQILAGRAPDGITVYYANGNVGEIGNRARANYNITNSTYNYNNFGGPGGLRGYVVQSDLYPQFNTYGEGGNGGSSGNNNALNDSAKGNNGTQGFCRVYYLY